MAKLVRGQPSIAIVNEQIDEEVLKEILEELRTNTTVVRLVFHDANMNHVHAHQIAQMLKGNSTIQVINFNENYNIGDVGTCNLATSIKENTGIREIHLDNVNMSSQGVCSLAQALVERALAQPSSCVELVSLEYNEIDKDGIYAAMAKVYDPIMGQKLHHGLADVIVQTNLKELNLNGNEIGNEGVKFLCDALQEDCSMLKVLRLKRNGINNEGFCYISTMLQKNKSLETIELNNNQIVHALDDENGRHDLTRPLAAIFASNRTLKVLSLRHNLLASQDIKSVQQWRATAKPSTPQILL